MTMNVLFKKYEDHTHDQPCNAALLILHHLAGVHMFLPHGHADVSIPLRSALAYVVVVMMSQRVSTEQSLRGATLPKDAHALSNSLADRSNRLGKGKRNSEKRDNYSRTKAC